MCSRELLLFNLLDQPSVACEQPSETEAKVVSYSHVTKDLSHDHDGSTALTLVDKAQGPTKVVSI